MTATLTEDPLDSLRFGSRVDPHGDMWNMNHYEGCTSRYDDENVYDRQDGGVHCSRAEHPPHWRHIAVSYREVVGTWKTWPEDQTGEDPFGHLNVGDTIERYRGENYRTPFPGWSREDGADCNFQISTDVEPDHQGYGRCSRAAHPAHWKHIAAGSSSVLGIAHDPNADLTAGEVDDPEVSEPIDVTPGKLVRFKNRTDLMLILGTRKQRASTGDVEVLDLTRKRFRVVESTSLIDRKEGENPTAEQVRWVAEYMAERRTKTRDVALQERRNGRFQTADQLNTVLDELGLERYTPQREGTFNTMITVRAPENASRDEINRALRAALDSIQLPEPYKVTRVARVENYGWDRV